MGELLSAGLRALQLLDTVDYLSGLLIGLALVGAALTALWWRKR
jgi:hypothetical protein